VDGLDLVQIARDRRHLVAARALEAIGDYGECFFPAGGLELAITADPGPVEPAPEQAVTGVPGLVVDPLLIHLVIDAWKNPHHLAKARIYADIGANRVHDVDAWNLPQFPRPRLEAVWLGDERADRTKVDHVAAQFGRDRALEIGRDLRILAATEQPDLLDAGDLLAKRTQRVQWMQRVMTVLTIGPIYFSVTARLFSAKRLWPRP
jgi:hypothetical protein